MSETTRRSFVALGAAGITSLAGLPKALAQTPGPIAVQQTAGTKRFVEESGLAWRPKSETAGNTVVVDPTKMYQDVRGFGAAMTDASTYLISQLPPDARQQFLHELFHPSELGIGVTRICVGSSDYSTAMYSYDEGEPDAELKRFSIEHDRAYIIPALLTARTINPELFILASPWSPPGWMKNGGSMLGGNLKPVNFSVYADYLIKFLQAYKDAGISVNAMTSQNEVDTDQAGRMPACAWAQEHEVVFVGKHLGPALAAANLDTKVWILDHNFNLWGRVYNTLEDPNLFKYVDGVAWHPYVGSVTSITRIHDAYPSTHHYVTEGSFGATANLNGPIEFAATPGPMTEGANTQADSIRRQQQDPAVRIAHGGLGATNAMRNWARCFINWNVVLNEKGEPNIGPFRGPGMMTIDSRTNEITRGPDYWVLKHFSHAATRGAKVVDSQGDIGGVAHVAFVNPDGRKCLVLSNTGAATCNLEVQAGGASADVALPGHSVTNLSWT